MLDSENVWPDEVTTDGARKCLSLPESFLNTVIGKLAGRVSHCIEFPQASTALALLSGASAAVSTAYAVQYRSGTTVQTGIYAVLEQPPSMQKSRLLGYAQRAYLDGVNAHNRRIWAQNDKAEEDGDKLKPAFSVATDATTAALDENLSRCSEGRFFIASAEQAAFQALFPTKGDFSSHNGLLLQGWQGEFASGMRKGRSSFTGVPFGSVLVIAQPGSAGRVFEASDGTGLAERFFFLSEPSPLGTRTLHDDYVTRDELAPFNKACAACVAEYSTRRFSDPTETQEPERLRQLKLTREGYDLLLSARREIEPKLGRLAADGELLQVGWLGKIETHTLKVAAVLHVVECLANDCKVPDQIPLALVKTALEFVQSLSDHLAELLHSTGETGEHAELDAVLELLTKGRPYTARALAQTLRKRHPFRAMQDAAYGRARARIASMLETGQLLITTDGTLRPV